MSELNEFQKWCKEILPVVQAAANGDTIQGRFYPDGAWEDCHASWEVLRITCEYRIKPKTIKVNGFDVPEPMRIRPVVGSTYWIVSLAKAEMCDDYTWEGGPIDELWLSRGICHTTDVAAIAHAKAMLGIDPSKD